MIDLIETIVGLLTGPPSFYHGVKSYQNLVADEESFAAAPAVYLDEPITSYDDIKQGGYID